MRLWSGALSAPDDEGKLAALREMLAEGVRSVTPLGTTEGRDAVLAGFGRSPLAQQIMSGTWSDPIPVDRGYSTTCTFRPQGADAPGAITGITVVVALDREGKIERVETALVQPGHIRNIVIGCPGGRWNEREQRVEGEPRELGAFYAELLGMRIIREDWIKVGKDSGTYPQLAFGDGWSDERPPRWPDPDYPQQLHIDVLVPDLDSADELVLGLGATPLQDKGRFRSYADPVGHPFCLYPDPDPGGESTASGRIGRIVLDCFSPRALAAFYEQLLSMPVRVENSPERVVIAREDGVLPMLAFQHAQFVAPRWPDPTYPAQVHLDLGFGDGTEARELAEGLGAIPLPKGGSCAVYADPAAHPFCLCSPVQ